jgi:threonine dehydratase
LSERAGATIALKAENLQRTGSFKLRGALAKLATLGEGCADGVVTASDGNHGQALAHAAKARGVKCEVFMPQSASIAKVEAVTALGATVRMVGVTVDESLAAAHERATQGGLAFVHPFDDPDVIAGQGTIGLELLRPVPDIARVVVPVGGGGVISGVAIALKSAQPKIELIGVQADTCAPFPGSLDAGLPMPVETAVTIADGHCRQAAGRAHARADPAMGRRDGGGRRRPSRRGDGVPARAREAGGARCRRGWRGGPARRPGRRRRSGGDGRDPLGR